MAADSSPSFFICRQTDHYMLRVEEKNNIHGNAGEWSLKHESFSGVPVE